MSTTTGNCEFAKKIIFSDKKRQKKNDENHEE
jgi:hypothetical protein